MHFFDLISDSGAPNMQVCSPSSSFFFFISFIVDFFLIVRIFLSISFSSVPLRNQTLAMEEMTGNNEIRLMGGVLVKKFKLGMILRTDEDVT